MDILPGTLEIIVLRTLKAMGPQHAYGIAARIEQVAANSIRLNQGTLYYAITRSGLARWPSSPSGGSVRRSS
jgi:DNA-binding PadR family transcriptional regulator